jgi:hypothetical protein
MFFLREHCNVNAVKCGICIYTGCFVISVPRNAVLYKGFVVMCDCMLYS